MSQRLSIEPSLELKRFTLVVCMCNFYTINRTISGIETRVQLIFNLVLCHYQSNHLWN